MKSNIRQCLASIFVNQVIKLALNHSCYLLIGGCDYDVAEH